MKGSILPHLSAYSSHEGLNKSKLFSLLCLLVLLSACFKVPEGESANPTTQTELEKSLEGRKEIIPGDKGFYVMGQQICYTDAYDKRQCLQLSSVDMDAYDQGFYIPISKNDTDVEIYAPYLINDSLLRGTDVRLVYYIGGSKVHSSTARFAGSYGASWATVHFSEYSGKTLEVYAYFNAIDTEPAYMRLPSVKVAIF